MHVNHQRIAFAALALGLLLGGASFGQLSDSKISPEMQTLVAVPDRPKAPDFTLTDTEGNTHTLSDYLGEVVIVNFWATWCRPCREEMPSMQRAWEKIRDQNGEILAVNWGDSEKSVGKFLESIPGKVEFPILLGGDKAMTSEWAIKGLPTTFIIDPEGRVAYRVAGDIEWDEEKTLEKILDLKKN